MTNLEEYAEPWLYDVEKPDFAPDGPFYLGLAQQVGGPVLELGCGTGRVTLPLAQQGIEITGLDVVPAMLARARAKAGQLPIRWVEADVRTFQLGTVFRLICEGGGVFQHMITRADQEAMLARVREHLADDGVFVVSVLFPRPDLMGDAQEHDWFAYTTREGYNVRVSGTEHYNHLTQVLTETAYRRWRDADSQEQLRVAPLNLRLFYPQELEALLHYNGFAVQERYGGWGCEPLTNDSRMIIVVCRKAASIESYCTNA